jgi:hypothetical protein
MKEMSLDRFISSVRSEVAKRFDLKTDAEIDAFFVGMEESAKDNQQALEKRDKMLRDTVAELCEAKRLLKMAVEDISKMSCNNDTHSPDSCYICVKHGNCSYADSFKWCRADEVLKLIGDNNDEP